MYLFDTIPKHPFFKIVDRISDKQCKNRFSLKLIKQIKTFPISETSRAKTKTPDIDVIIISISFTYAEL
jgi:hypothetical protein